MTTPSAWDRARQIVAARHLSDERLAAELTADIAGALEESIRELARLRQFLDFTFRAWISAEHVACDLSTCVHARWEQSRIDLLDAALGGAKPS